MSRERFLGKIAEESSIGSDRLPVPFFNRDENDTIIPQSGDEKVGYMTDFLKGDVEKGGAGQMPSN